MYTYSDLSASGPREERGCQEALQCGWEWHSFNRTVKLKL